MENGATKPTPANRKEATRTIDPVKNQGILKALTQKERNAAKLWQERWGFYLDLPHIKEEEALKLGMSINDYREAVKALNCQPEPKRYPVEVKPSPAPLPRTSNAFIGRRVQCPLEVYGKLVQTSKDIPLRPPLPTGQVYDPYKQTFIFLGIDCGDPISYKLTSEKCEIPPELLSKSHCPQVVPLSEESLQRALMYDNQPSRR